MAVSGKMTKYRMVQLALEERIREGEFSGGSALPPEHELARTYHVGRNTVRRAVADLTARGLLAKQQGRASRINRGGRAGESAPPVSGRMAWLSVAPHAALADNALYFDFFRVMAALASAHNLRLDFISISEPNWFEFYSANEYLAVFIAGGGRKSFSKLDYERLSGIRNLIALDNAGDPPGRFCVSTDDCESARLATRHLLEFGRRKIGFFCSAAQHTPVYWPFTERRRGYELALAEAQVPIRPEFIHYVRFHNLNYLLDELRKEGDCLREYDAVFAVTDLLAVLLVQLAREIRIKVPEELSIIGFDGWPAAQYLSPRLTTLRHPVEDIVQAAFNLALRLHDKPDLAGQSILLPGVLLPGETTAPQGGTA